MDFFRIRSLSTVTLVLMLFPHALTNRIRRRYMQFWCERHLSSVTPDPNGPYCDMTPTERYPNLFYSSFDMYAMIAKRQLGDLFTISSSKTKVEFPGPCQAPPLRGPSPPVQGILPQCPNIGSGQDRSDPCCTTKMYINIPWTVTSIYTSKTHAVIHTSDSYQLVHQAECHAATGSPCTFRGTCEPQDRIQWILVDMDGEDSFVPISVPNHCYCQYH